MPVAMLIINDIAIPTSQWEASLNSPSPPPLKKTNKQQQHSTYFSGITSLKTCFEKFISVFMTAPKLFNKHYKPSSQSQITSHNPCLKTHLCSLSYTTHFLSLSHIYIRKVPL